MSRLIGDTPTEGDWRLWKKHQWDRMCDSFRWRWMPLRIKRRMEMCYLESFYETQRRMNKSGIVFALPARVMAKGSGVYEFSTSVHQEPSPAEPQGPS